MTRLLAVVLLAFFSLSIRAQTVPGDKQIQPVQADFSRDQKIIALFQQYLEAIQSDDYLYRGMVKQFGERTGPKLRPFFVEYQRAKFTYPRFNDLVYGELQRNYREDLTLSDVFAYATLKSNQLLLSGLTRLDPKDWFELNEFLAKGAARVKDDSCKRVLGAGSDDVLTNGNAEAGIVRTLSDGDLMRYLSIYKRALEAERTQQQPKIVADPVKYDKALAYGRELASKSILAELSETEIKDTTNRKACDYFSVLSSIMTPPRMPPDLSAHYFARTYANLQFKVIRK